MHSSELLADFFASLEKRVAGDLRTDAYSRVLYSTDASIYQVMPDGVLLPRSIDDIQAAIELAASYRVQLLPRAAGTSLAGQTVNAALVIDTTRHLDQILEVNPAERWVRVQPGIVLDDLNRRLRPTGLQFGPDPASSNRAAIGGVVSNNATGSHSILYGMTADHVRSMRVFLDDGSLVSFGPLTQDELSRYAKNSGREGEIYRQLVTLTGSTVSQQTILKGTPRHWRRCGGYNLDRLIADPALTYRGRRDAGFNLAELLCGAEGTLGVIADVTLGLMPRPTMTALVIVRFDAASTALTAVPTILQCDPSAVELLDPVSLRLCRDVPAYARLLQTFAPGTPQALLVTEFYGETELELRAKVERLQRHIARQGVGATAVTPAYDPRLQANVWEVRKAGLGLLMSKKGDFKPVPFVEDTAVPVHHLAEYVGKIEQFCRDLGTEIIYYAHASAGCLHIRPFINTKSAREVAKLPQIAEFVVDLLHGYDGVLSSEHGDGRARSWLNERFFGPELYALYRQVKHIFDPHNIFNPGNIVDAGPMTHNLRFGASYDVIQLQTQLDFRHDLGFDRAVEMCNGAGVCRKLSDGTMCPSFMVTREEEHSTRGRANALRAALSGLLPPDELASPRMARVMELCISCKACKAECPSAVDMAKIKTEFLVQYYATHGTPLRARLFGHIGTLNRLGSGPLAPLANWTLRSSAVRWMLERTLGVSAARSLPPLAQRPFTTWYKQHSNANSSGRCVALFVDPFTNYNYPHVAIAAAELLEAAGFAVIVPPHHEDGRPFLSKGLVAQARQAADATLRHLAPLAEQGVAIIGLEPSSLLTLRDEYYTLLPNDPRVPLVAEMAFTFEEFVAQLADAGNLDLAFTAVPRHVLLHGHCHQKAIVGTQPSRQVLALPRNYTVTEVDSGCCGMAGSFGYEAEHYDISLQMAERRLLPAVRAAAAETLITAPGVSCRQQIHHGSGRRALHPAEILRDAMV